MDTFRQKIVLITLGLFLYLGGAVWAEKVGIFTSTDPYNSGDSVTLSVPKGVVGLSGEVAIAGDTSHGSLSATSLFFMIDHSGSMEDIEKDPQGNRFRLISRLIDTLASQPDRFPDIECGLGVFGSILYHNQSNSTLMKSLPAPFDTGSYLPLVDLAKRYPTDSNKTGAEILKGLVELSDSFVYTPVTGALGQWWVADTTHYFKYNDGLGAKWYHKSDIGSTDTVVVLSSKSAPSWNGGTIIDYGFQAAVAALKESKNPKKNQFVLFISDGESINKDDCLDGNLNGGVDLIPTTFTIYFTGDSTAPPKILQINESIKENGFSSSNDKHTKVEAYKNSTIDKLIAHVMDSIVSVFAVNSILSPNTLTINGVSGGTWSSTEGAFLFSHSFALTGDTTGFNFVLDATIKKDSVDALGVVKTHSYDTTINFNAEVLIDSTTKEDALKGDIMWWDRELALLHKGAIVTEISEVNDSLLLRFSYDKLGGTYTYTTVPLEIVTVNSKDTLHLNAISVGGNTFEVVLPVDYTGVMSISDGQLTPDSTDTFICTFRNNETHRLPLDTLQHQFTFAKSTEIRVESGAMHDRNADGILDEITVELSGDTSVITKGASEIVSHLQFPPSRGITVLSSTTKGSTLSIAVTTTLGVTTGVQFDDTILVSTNAVISTGGVLQGGVISLKDKMAPVVTSALLLKRSTNLYDTLTLSFSEPLDSITVVEPFLVEFLTGGTLLPRLIDKSSGSASHLFEVGRVDSDKISMGDSLSFNVAAAIEDVFNNGQTNTLNKRVPVILTEVEKIISTSEIRFTDPQGRGFPSVIEVTLSDTVTLAARDSIASVMTSWIQSIPGRNLIVDSVNGAANDVYFNVTETGAVFNTAVGASDSLNLSTPVSLPNYYTLAMSTVFPEDKMAPVITIAQLKKKSTNLYDSLTVTFSESIDSVTVMKPFISHVNKGGAALSPMLVDVSGSLQSHIFLISRTESDMITAGDSLSCNIDAALSDPLGNGQISLTNKRVPITIIHENVDITISEVSFTDPAGKGYPSVIDVTLSDTVTLAARDSISSVLKSLIQSIPGRNLIVDSISGIAKDIHFNVTETGVVFNTSVEARDSLVIHSSVVLPNHYELNTGAILPNDKMAPVSVSAKLFDNALDGEDSLVVTFSESVMSTIGSELFFFYSSTGSYPIDHSVKGSMGSRGIFILPDMDGDRVVAGDSLHFQIGAAATDALGNVQLAPNNKKTVIDIVKPLQQITIESVSFRDPLGQGNAFEILVTLSKELPIEMQGTFEEVMVDYIENIKNRQLTVDSAKWSGVTCQLLTSTGNPDFINTAILADDNLTIGDTISLSTQVFIHGESITPVDNMAPVLVAASCVDSLKSDTVQYVEMRFSENITNSSSFTKEVPFYFFDTSATKHSVELDFVSQTNEVLVTYPTTLKAGSFWASMDSVQIRTGFGISDGSNSQTAPTNRKVALRYEYVLAPLELEIKASTITPLSEVGYITIGPKNKNALLPNEDISATVTIVDHVGNTILHSKSTTYSNGVALLQWDGNNGIGRKVGSGHYLVIAEVQGGSRIDGSTFDTVELQTLMGVKR